MLTAKWPYCVEWYVSSWAWFSSYTYRFVPLSVRNSFHRTRYLRLYCLFVLKCCHFHLGYTKTQTLQSMPKENQYSYLNACPDSSYEFSTQVRTPKPGDPYHCGYKPAYWCPCCFSMCAHWLRYWLALLWDKLFRDSRRRGSQHTSQERLNGKELAVFEGIKK